MNPTPAKDSRSWSAFWVLWALACSLLLYLWPSLVLDLPVWRSAEPQSKAMLVCAFLHLGAALVIGYENRGDQRPGYLFILGLSLGACGVFTLYAHLVGLRKILILLPWILSPSMQLAGSFLTHRPNARLFQTVTVTTLLISLAFLGLNILNPGSALQKFRSFRVKLVASLRPQPDSATNRLHTTQTSSAYYPLKLTWINEPLLRNQVPGGGWSKLDGDLFLLCTGEGKLFLCSNLDNPGALAIQPLPFSVPLNRDRFVTEARSTAIIHHEWFRVASAFASSEGDRTSIFAIYHHWNSSTQHFLVRLAVASGQTADLLAAKVSLEWRVLWESTPGLPVHEVPKPGKLSFAGLQIGGRIAQLDPDTLVFGVGDHEFDGVNADQIHPQDPGASYGKTFLYRKSTGKVEPYTMGNRNPQGMHVGSDGRIWETEHGPQGGDELNLLQSGKNYGWPLATIGTEYRKHQWPLSRSPGDHSGFTTPVYAWGKSIAISNLVEMRGKLFPAWRGHLVIGSLGAQSLFRVRLEGDRILSIEDILLRVRIRDIIETPEGRLALWTDTGEILLIEPTEQQALAIPAAFTQCIICHSPYTGSPNGAGPYLWGFASRDIASAAGFPYSEPLRRQKGKWTREKLDAFLENPQLAVPGTMMPLPTPNPQDRKEIIDFLLKLE